MRLAPLSHAWRGEKHEMKNSVNAVADEKVSSTYLVGMCMARSECSSPERVLRWMRFRKKGERAERRALWQGSSSLGRKPYSELPESGRRQSPLLSEVKTSDASA